jgi:hypothetical protein
MLDSKGIDDDLGFGTLKMETVFFSEILVPTDESTRHQNPEIINLSAAGTSNVAKELLDYQPVAVQEECLSVSADGLEVKWLNH